MKTLLSFFVLFVSLQSFCQVVTSTADAGPGTLREAVDNAGPGAVITFSPALAGSTINLTSSLMPTVNMTIDGGTNDITISGGGSVRIFHANGTMNIQLFNLTLTQGAGVSIGAAFYAEGGANLQASACTFIDNQASNDGGALRLFGGGTHVFRDCKFIGNSGNSWGGAIYTIFCSIELEDCLFTGNRAASGGAAYFRGGTTIVNCTFAGNYANTNGGAMYIRNGSSVNINNSIFWNNQAGGNTNSVQAFYQIESGSTVDLNVQSSDIQGSGGSVSWASEFGSDLGGNLDVDPLFANPIPPPSAPTTAGDYRPQPPTTTIDNASNALNISPVDVRGHPRVYNGQIDMGADEYCTTFSTINETVCADYTSPSGKYIYNVSGVYSDTIDNYLGCDSVITINLTVQNTFNAYQDTACISMLSPSGLYTWSSSGTYQDTIPNSAGCDSILTVGVVIHPTTYNSFSVDECYSYTSPSGNYTYTSSGTYNDTIPNVNGCDSVLTINVSINTSYNTINETACDSYLSPSGMYTFSSSGSYNDTITNYLGCDSVITINLTILNKTFSTINPTVCETYTVPSGTATYTSSGTYNDTIPNSVGCDSIITINLTVNYNSFNTLNEFACESYTTPSGLYTFTSSGTYNDTIPNTLGCDSILTINLTVAYNTISSISLSGCDSVVSPSGIYTWFTDGIYNDTLSNSAGCDSVITVDATIYNATSSTLVKTACEQYISPSGNYTYTTSGIYNDTIPNSVGCDSVITIQLTVNYNTFATLNEDACYEYTSPSGLYVFNQSGTYSDTITNVQGCDSILTINLSILTSYSIIDSSACDSIMSPSGSEVYEVSGVYQDTLTNVAGCDSIITFNFTLIEFESIISEINGDLQSDVIADSYSWINCDSNSVITASNSEVYSPSISGDYALEIELFGCKDTSDCFFIDVPIDHPTAFSPNGDGINDRLILDIRNPVNTVIIYNRWGDVIARFENYDNENVSWDGSMPSGQIISGTYFYVIESDTKESGWIQIVN